MAVHQLGGVALNAGMLWVDEFDWQAMVTTAVRGIEGHHIVDGFVKTAGRPITLQATDTHGWLGMTRSKVLALQALADAGQEMDLELADGRLFRVRFAPEQPLQARPVSRPEVPTDVHPYVVTVRLITV